MSTITPNLNGTENEMGAVKAIWMDAGEPDLETWNMNRNDEAIVRTPIIEAWAFKGAVYCKLWRNAKADGTSTLRQLAMFRLISRPLSDERAEATAARVEEAGDIDLFLWTEIKVVWEGEGGKQKPTREELIAEGKRTGICQVCHRKLTNPKSIEAGIGPVCAGRI